MKGIIGRIAGGAIALTLAGCAFTGLRREPENVPTFRYANPKLQAVTHDIPVVVDYSDCVELAMVTDVGVMGGRDFIGTFPLRHIAMRELGRFVDENMRHPMEGEAEKLVMKVDSKMVLVEQKGRKSHTEMRFDIQLVDPRDTDARPYYRNSFKGEWHGFHEDDEVVPDSVYQSVGMIVCEFAKGLAADRQAMRRLSLLARPDDRVEPPSLKSIEFDSLRNGIVFGRCEVECNGWDGFDADKWARAQVHSSCRMKLGIEAERVRVVYSKDVFDSKRKMWSYEFRAFARAPMVVDYDPVTRTGTCIGDLGLLNMSIAKASKKMEEFVIAEMRVHGGAVGSAIGDVSTRVRFSEVKTDTMSNLLQIGFSLPY